MAAQGGAGTGDGVPGLLVDPQPVAGGQGGAVKTTLVSFDGKGSALDAWSWLQQAKVVKAMSGFNNARSGSMFVSALTGEAKQWFSMLLLKGTQNVTDWETIVPLFEAQYVTQLPLSFVDKLMDDLHQRASESCKAFFVRCDMAFLAGEFSMTDAERAAEAHVATRDRNVKFAIWKGLRQGIKNACMIDVRTCTRAQLEAEALRIEGNQADLQGKIRANVYAAGASNEGQDDNADHDAAAAYVNAGFTPEQAQILAARGGFRGRGRGRGRGGRGGRGDRGGGSGGVDMCYKCGFWGEGAHSAPNCKVDVEKYKRLEKGMFAKNFPGFPPQARAIRDRMGLRGGRYAAAGRDSRSYAAAAADESAPKEESDQKNEYDVFSSYGVLN